MWDTLSSNSNEYQGDDVKKREIITFASTLMLSCGSSFASEIQFDKSVAEAAARQAAEKVGELRPSIDFDQEPGITQLKDLDPKAASEYEQPENDSQRITSLQNPNDDLVSEYLPLETRVDLTTTASINPNVSNREVRVVWQKFDADGNLIR